ncbi:MAG: hypothetical protein LBR11_08360, partial [Deltaproteobacteria bacterium]|nr:hypothetical protein [Deltaproteobacteria bacterium]
MAQLEKKRSYPQTDFPPSHHASPQLTTNPRPGTRLSGGCRRLAKNSFDLALTDDAQTYGHNVLAR